MENVEISNIQLSPAPPATVDIGQTVNVFYDYTIASPSVCTYIWVYPYLGDQQAYAATKPSSCKTGSGQVVRVRIYRILELTE